MLNIGDLKHIRRSTKCGVEILLLDTGAIIGPEVEAMIQALQSRSDKGVEHHLKIVAERGAEKFMASTYVGYGHKSIGDCGSITIFIEGGSMLVAKAFQDWPLYNGQEGSTRYMNFGTQEFKNPCGTDSGHWINERWREFYLGAKEDLVHDLTRRFPFNGEEDKDEAAYLKAIDARAFDILRGFLPAGSSTKFSYHLTLRQIADELMRLRHHSLEEVREIALAVEDALIERYPGSFSHKDRIEPKRYEATESFNENWMRNRYYFRFLKDPGFTADADNINLHRLDLYAEILANRPAKTDLPKELASCGTVEFNFLLDFASFRDLQRHRAINQRMPLLDTRAGFEPWYLEELPSGLRDEAKSLLDRQEHEIKNLKASPEEKQYYVAMGYRTECEIVGNLPALIYLVELRATRFVHPTLRKRAFQMADFLSREFEEYGLKIHLDQEPDRFDVKRGQHDIVMKE
ncbi:MAG: FAD-dependent thymidylate synthase [bacterium]|nr:FAD-dependent thymidylate synthase [bacterium]